MRFRLFCAVRPTALFAVFIQRGRTAARFGRRLLQDRGLCAGNGNAPAGLPVGPTGRVQLRVGARILRGALLRRKDEHCARAEAQQMPPALRPVARVGAHRERLVQPRAPRLVEMEVAVAEMPAHERLERRVVAHKIRTARLVRPRPERKPKHRRLFTCRHSLSPFFYIASISSHVLFLRSICANVMSRASTASHVFRPKSSVQGRCAGRKSAASAAAAVSEMPSTSCTLT